MVHIGESDYARSWYAAFLARQVTYVEGIELVCDVIVLYKNLPIDLRQKRVAVAQVVSSFSSLHFIRWLGKVEMEVGVDKCLG